MHRLCFLPASLRGRAKRGIFTYSIPQKFNCRTTSGRMISICKKVFSALRARKREVSSIIFGFRKITLPGLPHCSFIYRCDGYADDKKTMPCFIPVKYVSSWKEFCFPGISALSVPLMKKLSRATWRLNYRKIKAAPWFISWYSVRVFIIFPCCNYGFASALRTRKI